MFFQLQGPNCKVYAFMDKSKGKKANEIDFAISTLKKQRSNVWKLFDKNLYQLLLSQ